MSVHCCKHATYGDRPCFSTKIIFRALIISTLLFEYFRDALLPANGVLNTAMFIVFILQFAFGALGFFKYGKLLKTFSSCKKYLIFPSAVTWMTIYYSMAKVHLTKSTPGNDALGSITLNMPSHGVFQVCTLHQTTALARNLTYGDSLITRSHNEIIFFCPGAEASVCFGGFCWLHFAIHAGS